MFFYPMLFTKIFTLNSIIAKTDSNEKDSKDKLKVTKKDDYVEFELENFKVSEMFIENFTKPKKTSETSKDGEGGKGGEKGKDLEKGKDGKSGETKKSSSKDGEEGDKSKKVKGKEVTLNKSSSSDTKPGELEKNVYLLEDKDGKSKYSIGKSSFGDKSLSLIKVKGTDKDGKSKQMVSEKGFYLKDGKIQEESLSKFIGDKDSDEDGKPWYKSVWFWILMVAIVAGLILLIYFCSGSSSSD